MKLILVLMVGSMYFIGFARAESSNVTDNVTDSPFITCPPEPTCLPVEECTCPPVIECPTTESTRTRRPGRTGTRRTRTNEQTNRTRTHHGSTRSDGTNSRTNRTHSHTGRIGPGRRRSRTHTRHGRTRNDRTGGRTNRTRPIIDCTPKLPLECEDFITTAQVETFTTGTASSSPPQPVTTPPPRRSPNVCSSSVIDATGKREIPMIVLQFRVSEKNPFEFAQEATDFAEVISLLALESVGLDTVSAAVLGISAQENGLSVVVAVSFNVTANKDYTLSSSQIVQTLVKHLDQLGEYYHVTDMKTVRMVAQNYSPSSDSIKPETNLSASAVSTIFLSVLAMIGILCTFVVLTVKFSGRFSRQPNENQPLLEDRFEEKRRPSVQWSKKNDTIIF